MFSPQKEIVIIQWDGTVKAMAVIILKYLSVSNQYIVHLKLKQCYVLIISQ